MTTGFEKKMLLIHWAIRGYFKPPVLANAGTGVRKLRSWWPVYAGFNLCTTTQLFTNNNPSVQPVMSYYQHAETKRKASKRRFFSKFKPRIISFGKSDTSMTEFVNTNTEWRRSTGEAIINFSKSNSLSDRQKYHSYSFIFQSCWMIESSKPAAAPFRCSVKWSSRCTMAIYLQHKIPTELHDDIAARREFFTAILFSEASSDQPVDRLYCPSKRTVSTLEIEVQDRSDEP